jgi:hypothetical protein
VYPGIQEYREEAIELRRPPKQQLDAFNHVGLIERIWRNRGRNSEETRDDSH